MPFHIHSLPIERQQDTRFWAALVDLYASEGMASRLLGIEKGNIEACRRELFCEQAVRELLPEEEEQCLEDARNYGLMEGSPDFDQVIRNLRFRRSMPPNWALDIPFPSGHKWRLIFDPSGIIHSLRSPDEPASSDSLPLAEHDKDQLGHAAALRWAEAQALQKVLPDRLQDAVLLLWPPIIGLSLGDNFDDFEAAMSTAIDYLSIAVDRDGLIRYFTYFELDEIESAERCVFLQSIGVSLKGAEPYTEPHRLTFEWRLDPDLGWVNNASHSYRNPEAEGEEWLEMEGFERFAEFLKANGVSD